MSTNAINKIEEKVSSALVLSSLAFVIIVIFVILWPFRKKLLLIGKPAIGRCFKWTQNELENTRKKIVDISEKSGGTTHTTAKKFDKGDTNGTQHVYATIEKDRKDVALRRSPSCISNDSDFSASDNAIDETGEISVELHAYKTFGLAPCEKSSMPLKEVRLCDTQQCCLDNNDAPIIDQTSGSRIYDEVERDGRKSPYCV